MSSPWSSAPVIAATIFQIARPLICRRFSSPCWSDAADHEARRDFGLIDIEAREKLADDVRHLQTAAGLAERLADLREFLKRRHLQIKSRKARAAQ